MILFKGGFPMKKIIALIATLAIAMLALAG